MGPVGLAGSCPDPPAKGMGSQLGMGRANSTPKAKFGGPALLLRGKLLAYNLPNPGHRAGSRGGPAGRSLQNQDGSPAWMARGPHRPSRFAMPVPPAPPGAEPALPRWMRLLGAGLTALVAVLALVLLQQLQQQASRNQALEGRVQDLENRRDLERAQALEAQLRALAERLQGLEASAGQVQELELQQQELRRQLQGQLKRPSAPPPEFLPFNDPYLAPAPGPLAKPGAKPAAKSPAQSLPKAKASLRPDDGRLP